MVIGIGGSPDSRFSDVTQKDTVDVVLPHHLHPDDVDIVRINTIKELLKRLPRSRCRTISVIQWVLASETSSSMAAST